MTVKSVVRWFVLPLSTIGFTAAFATLLTLPLAGVAGCGGDDGGETDTEGAVEPGTLGAACATNVDCKGCWSGKLADPECKQGKALLCQGSICTITCSGGNDCSGLSDSESFTCFTPAPSVGDDDDDSIDLAAGAKAATGKTVSYCKPTGGGGDDDGGEQILCNSDADCAEFGKTCDLLNGVCVGGGNTTGSPTDTTGSPTDTTGGPTDTTTGGTDTAGTDTSGTDTSGTDTTSGTTDTTTGGTDTGTDGAQCLPDANRTQCERSDIPCTQSNFTQVCPQGYICPSSKNYCVSAHCACAGQGCNSDQSCNQCLGTCEDKQIACTSTNDCVNAGKLGQTCQSGFCADTP
jgi:hypothetical protein